MKTGAVILTLLHVCGIAACSELTPAGALTIQQASSASGLGDNAAKASSGASRFDSQGMDEARPSKQRSLVSATVDDDGGGGGCDGGGGWHESNEGGILSTTEDASSKQKRRNERQELEASLQPSQLNAVPELPQALTVGIGCLVADLVEDSAGQQIAKGLKLAAQHINDHPSLLSGLRFNFSWFNAGNTQFNGMGAAIQALASDVVALVGPMYSSQVHAIADLMKSNKVPLVSYSATDPTLSLKGQFPFFVRMAHSDQNEMEAIADLLLYFGWRQMVFIYSDDDFGRNGIQVLTDILARRGLDRELSVKLPMPPLADEATIVERLTNFQSLEVSVYVLHASTYLTATLFPIASRFGFMAEGNVWVVSEGSTSAFESMGLNSTALQSAQGIIGTKSYLKATPGLTKFQRAWENAYGPGIPNVYAFFAYDALWLVARSLHHLIVEEGLTKILMSMDKSGRYPQQGGRGGDLDLLKTRQYGRLILDAIVSTKFEGVTGSISMDANNDLEGAQYEIINFVQGELKPVGRWSQGVGLMSLEGNVVGNEDSRKMGGSRSGNSSSSSSSNIKTASDSGVASGVANRTRSEEASSDSTTSENPAGIFGQITWPGNSTEVPRGWLPRNGPRLRIAVPDIGPTYAKFVAAGPNNTFTGYFVEAFVEAVKILPYSFPYEFIRYGDGDPSLSYTKMLQEVADRKYDGAIGDITVNRERSTFVDFTYPLVDSTLSLIVSTSQHSPVSPWSFLVPFTPEMWELLLGSFAFTALVLWYLEHHSNREFGNKAHQQISTALWFSFSAMIAARTGHIKSYFARLVMIFWLFIVLIITNSYTANLTSILTVKNLRPNAQTLAALISSDSKIGFQQDSYTETFLKQLGVLERQLVPLDGIDSFGSALRSGDADAVIDENPYLDLFLTRECGFSTTQRGIAIVNWAFAFQKGSHLAKDLSTAITQLNEEGRLLQIHRRWFEANSTCPTMSSSPTYRLSAANFLFLFIFYAAFGIICCVGYAVLLFKRGQLAKRVLAERGIATSVIKRLDDEDGSVRSKAANFEQTIRLGSAWSMAHNMEFSKSMPRRLYFSKSFRERVEGAQEQGLSQRSTT